MSESLVLHRGESSVARQEAPILSQPFQLLDVYAPSGTVDAAPRVDAIATISAGEKGANGKFPTRSTDGKIILHDPEGRAPGLKAALAFAGNKSLTIAFPFDDMGTIIQQRFAEYSATNLLAYGDAKEITILDRSRVGKADRIVVQAGTPEYREALSRCKVSVSVYFHLAQWKDNNAEVFFPDGLGLYRLRFTSRNSLRSIVASLQTTARYMGGRLAGIPFKLSLENIEVAGPDGAKRKIPVWRCLFATPDGFSLSSQNFRDVATKALAQGSALMLPAPRAESLEMAALEGPEADLDELTEAQVAEVAMGGKCDAEHYRRAWFALVRKTPLDSDEGRADYVTWYSAEFDFEVVASLSQLLSQMSEEQAQKFMKHAGENIAYLLDEAKGAYNLVLERGAQIGIKPRALPEGATFHTIATYTASLESAIARRAAPGEAPALSEEAETSEVESAQVEVDNAVEAEVVEPVATPEKPVSGLKSAVRQKAETASQSTPEEQAEIDTIYADAVVDDGVVASEDEQGEIPEHIRFWMTFVHDRGVQHGGDFAFPAMIESINAYRLSRRNPHPPITSVAGLSEPEISSLITAVGKGQLEFGLV